ncbi:hypothetical protein TWF696_007879 [Orbilia brochopaga]|uniref:Altered inheritance of mitochondria protein 32 n=1 Tax=Orbilia brochopaga TaxID=3140254 RepID=A0AAV9UQ84_9PEZI
MNVLSCQATSRLVNSRVFATSRQRFAGHCGGKPRLPTPTRNAARSLSSRSLRVPATNTCHCASEAWDPEHENLDIERDKPIAGAITRHYRHVLIHTGTTDWPKRIEDMSSTAGMLKSLVSAGSALADPLSPILVTNSSWPTPPESEQGGSGTVTMSLFPEAIEVCSIPNSMDGLKSFATSFLLHPSSEYHTPHGNERDPAFTIKNITKPVILTCSHGSRDMRCGILGPAIIKAFAEALEKQSPDNRIDAILGEISHIGGHKYAGNVIIHLPGDHELAKMINKAPTAFSPLSDTVSGTTSGTQAGVVDTSGRSVAIWYGRVLPGHAESLLDTTVRKGKVVKELLRGIANSDGDLIDLKAAGLQNTLLGSK